MPTVLLSNGVPMEGFSFPADYSVIAPTAGAAFSREEMLLHLPRADAVLACTAMDEAMIRAGEKLRLIVCYGAGYDAIDLAAATRLHIPVANIPDTVTDATAELAMAMMLCLNRRICELDQRMRQGNAADAFGLGKHMGHSLRGACLGIVGMGRIGSRVAEFGRFMGMDVLYVSPSPKPEAEKSGAKRCSLETLMRKADVVSLHCPHRPETDRLLTRELLSLMKPTAFLINTARGRILDEDALLEMLRENRIAGAGLDVYANEPCINPAFASLSNTLLTPHVGSNTIEARREMALAVSVRMVDALSGRMPENLLNPQVWDERKNRTNPGEFDRKGVAKK